MAITQEKITKLFQNKSVELYDINLTDEEAGLIAEALKNNTTVKKLVLTRCQLSDEGAIKIAAALTNNTTLTKLDLYENNIGDDGAIAFAEALKINQTLLTFNISKNSISNRGAIAFLPVLNETNSLKELSIASTKKTTQIEGAPTESALGEATKNALEDAGYKKDINVFTGSHTRSSSATTACALFSNKNLKVGAAIEKFKRPLINKQKAQEILDTNDQKSPSVKHSGF